METAKKITHILFLILLGMILVGAIVGITALWVTCLIILGVDIIVGITLQYLMDKPKVKDNWNNLSFDEKHKIVHSDMNSTIENLRKEGYDVAEEVRKVCELEAKIKEKAAKAEQEELAKKV